MRRLLSLLATVLFGVLVALGIGEGVARLIGDPPLAAVVRDAVDRKGTSAAVMSVADGRVFAGRPGGSPDRPLNRLGLRDPEPVDGGCTVALLGDSVAWGHGLEEASMLARRLEARLEARVHTLAFPGWNTAQEAAALEVLGPELDPDVVLVLWVPNDAASLEVEGADAMYVERRVRLLPGIGAEAQIALWHRSWLFRRIGDALGDEEVLLEAREHAEALGRIAATSRALEATPLLAQVPPLVSWSGWRETGPGTPAPPWVREGPWRAAVDATEQHGIKRFDLGRSLAGTDPQTLRLSPSDRVHPSAEAVDRFAEALAPWLSAELGACR